MRLSKPRQDRRLPEHFCSSCNHRTDGVFCALGQEALATLDSEKTWNTYKRGQTLFLEGDQPFGLYCVQSGTVKITKLGLSGKETIVRIATRGDILGHRSLFSGVPYSASATALDDATLCFIRRETIQKLIRDHPALSTEVIKYLSSQMGASEDRIVSLSQKNLRERFCELLLLLTDASGKPQGGRTKLQIRLTRREMASVLGAAIENVIRLVTEFKHEGLIEQEGDTIYLRNIPKIREYASLQ